MTEDDIEKGWHQTFSTSNPFCPCDLKSFTKAVKWAECNFKPVETHAWQSINSAPKDGTRFLAVLGEHVDFFRWQDFGDGSDAPVGWRDSFITVYKEGTGPTYWMPLPAMPTP